MSNSSRRGLLAGAAMATGAIAGCALPAGAARNAKTPFDVPAATIPIAGSDQVFPVRRIYCIGRNYAAHAREMGSDPTREPPFFFQKPCARALSWTTLKRIQRAPSPHTLTT